MSSLAKKEEATVSNVTEETEDFTASAFPHPGTPEEEAGDEAEWERQFAGSKAFLKQLADEAREERRQGTLLPLETIFDD